MFAWFIQQIIPEPEDDHNLAEIHQVQKEVITNKSTKSEHQQEQKSQKNEFLPLEEPLDFKILSEQVTRNKSDLTLSSNQKLKRRKGTNSSKTQLKKLQIPNSIPQGKNNDGPQQSPNQSQNDKLNISMLQNFSPLELKFDNRTAHKTSVKRNEQKQSELKEMFYAGLSTSFERFSIMADVDYKMTVRDSSRVIRKSMLLERESSWSTACGKEDLLYVDWKFLSEQSGSLSNTQLKLIRQQIISNASTVSPKLRGQFWVKVFDIEQIQADHNPKIYCKLLEFSNEEAEHMISKDVARTLSELKLWQEDLNCGNNKLFNVLKAFANYDNEVGYVQGLNYVVAMMLYYINDEEQVFWCLMSLMQGKWQWRWIYTEGFPKLNSLLDLLAERLQLEFPRIKQHLSDNCLETTGTFSPLFMTLFVYMTPFDVATKLFELFLIDGELVLIRLLLKMIELKYSKILQLEDTELQKYMLSGMVIECTRNYKLEQLLC